MASGADFLSDLLMTSNRETQLLHVITLVVWLVCLAVGIAGWWLPYSRSRPPPKHAEPVQAELIDVKIAQEPSAPLPPQATPQQSPPALSTPAAPSSAVSFAIPTKLLPQPSIRSARPIATPTTQQLIYGQGEGVQPAPEYPIEAQLAGQHGVVVIRFTVNQDGNVTRAQVISPSPWPLLNQSAVRAVRETWRFRAGSVRSYEVSIQFVLRQTP
jgi:periplasmic protein TonB